MRLYVKVMRFAFHESSWLIAKVSGLFTNVFCLFTKASRLQKKNIFFLSKISSMGFHTIEITLFTM